jgi:hypothetical protein
MKSGFLSDARWVDTSGELARASWHTTGGRDRRNARACRYAGGGQLYGRFTRQVRAAFTRTRGNAVASASPHASAMVAPAAAGRPDTNC